MKKHSFDINAILVHWSLFADPQIGATLRDDLRRILFSLNLEQELNGNWKRDNRNMWEISMYIIPDIVFLVTLFFLLAFLGQTQQCTGCIPVSNLRNHYGDSQGSICSTREWTYVSCVHGKSPTHCLISPGALQYFWSLRALTPYLSPVSSF